MFIWAWDEKFKSEQFKLEMMLEVDWAYLA